MTKKCKNCNHPKVLHKGINGECCNTDENAEWNCNCQGFIDDKLKEVKEEANGK